MGMAETAGQQLSRVLAAVVVAGALVATGCSSSGSGGDKTAAPTTSSTAERPTTDSSTTTSIAAPASTTNSIAAPATTATTPTTTRRLDGDPVPGCASGWTTPAPGTALRGEPLDVIRDQIGVTGDFQVIDMRHFTSPEVPWILAPRPPVVEWWYVKAQLVGDPTFRARWLIAKRSAAIKGTAAVARFDTTGYRSPDWRAFIGEGELRAMEGLPGTWVGFEFDFTKGEDNEKPGLPEEAIHCLDNT
jgi:hypothetical protein